MVPLSLKTTLGVRYIYLHFTDEAQRGEATSWAGGWQGLDLKSLLFLKHDAFSKGEPEGGKWPWEQNTSFAWRSKSWRRAAGIETTSRSTWTGLVCEAHGCESLWLDLLPWLWGSGPWDARDVGPWGNHGTPWVSVSPFAGWKWLPRPQPQKNCFEDLVPRYLWCCLGIFEVQDKPLSQVYLLQGRAGRTPATVPSFFSFFPFLLLTFIFIILQRPCCKMIQVIRKYLK